MLYVERSVGLLVGRFAACQKPFAFYKGSHL